MNLRVLLALAAIVGIGIFGWSLLRNRPTDPSPEQSATTAAAESSERIVDIEAMRPQVVAFCADCHGMPDPSTFPRDAWYGEVDRGYRFFRQFGRSDLVVPNMNDVVAWYRQQAPAKWEVPGSSADTDPLVQFDRQPLLFTEAAPLSPAVSNLHWVETPNNADQSLRFCDMRTGHVSSVSLATSELTSSTLTQLKNPAHVENCDLDQDGLADLIVAELGSFQPGDHQHGKIIWLRQLSEPGRYESIPLLENLGRVADVQSADFNQDGKPDLVVAEFGWMRTGRVLMLMNTSEKAEQPAFSMQVIDSRHGAIHVPVTDLNGDSLPDFLALISQEFEVIEAFLNRGDGTFEKNTIYSAGDPSYGSSGIQLVDLDNDADVDVLYSNGDSLDSHYLKPTHAVHWLENTGNLKFVSHEIARLPGASCAVAGDLDGDGDADVVATSYLPATLLSEAPTGTYDSVVWYENRGDQQFVPHRLENSALGHLALELGDFDRDGDLDMAIGNHGEPQAGEKPEWLSIWWNRRIPGERGAAH